MKKLIDFVFPDLNNNCLDETRLSERALRTTRNTNLDALNSFFGDLSIGEAKRFVSDDNIDSADMHKLRSSVELQIVYQERRRFLTTKYC